MQGWLCKSCPFGELIALIFFQITVVFLTGTATRICFKHEISVSTIFFFSKYNLQSFILWSSGPSCFKRWVATGHSIFDRIGFFCQFFLIGWFFLTEQLQLSTLSGVIEHNLLRRVTSLEDLSYSLEFFKGKLLISPLQLQPSILWSSVYVSAKERMTVIQSLKGTVFILTG